MGKVERVRRSDAYRWLDKERMLELMDYLWGMCRDEAREAGLER